MCQILRTCVWPFFLSLYLSRYSDSTRQYQASSSGLNLDPAQPDSAPSCCLSLAEVSVFSSGSPVWDELAITAVVVFLSSHFLPIPLGASFSSIPLLSLPGHFPSPYLVPGGSEASGFSAFRHLLSALVILSFLSTCWFGDPLKGPCEVLGSTSFVPRESNPQDSHGWNGKFPATEGY